MKKWGLWNSPSQFFLFLESNGENEEDNADQVENKEAPKPKKSDTPKIDCKYQIKFD